MQSDSGVGDNRVPRVFLDLLAERRSKHETLAQLLRDAEEQGNPELIRRVNVARRENARLIRDLKRSILLMVRPDLVLAADRLDRAIEKSVIATLPRRSDRRRGSRRARGRHVVRRARARSPSRPSGDADPHPLATRGRGRR